MPGAPTVADAGASTASLTWTPATGGGTASSYLIRVYGAGGTTPLMAVESASPTPSLVVTGLTTKVYRFTVAGRNVAGVGPESAFSSYALPPFTSVGAFVTQQFLDFAGRAPSGAESRSWISELTNGTVEPVAKVDGAAGGPDWSPKVDPISRLYYAFFERSPDSGGLGHWTAQRRKGRSLVSIAAHFARSSEFRRTYGALDNQAFVELVYDNVLGRDSDGGGVDFWTARLDDGTSTRAQVMVGFSESREHRRRRAGEVNTIDVFFGLLRRVPTAAELGAFKPLAATSRVPVIAMVIKSDEYSGRI